MEPIKAGEKPVVEPTIEPATKPVNERVGTTANLRGVPKEILLLFTLGVLRPALGRRSEKKGEVLRGLLLIVESNALTDTYITFDWRLDDVPSLSARSTGIRYAKPYTLRDGPSTKLGQRSIAKGVGLCVADSRTGTSTKNALAIQRCELSRKELDEFLSSYSIPSEYRVILPTPTQTILDAPPR
nr:hypothetical protein [Tanacetum cinerariifolium]